MSKPWYSISSGMPQISPERKARLDAFAPYVAVLPWFSSDLLQKLFVNVFVPESGLVLDDPAEAHKIRAITCADFMQSPRVERIGFNVYDFLPEIRDALRQVVLQAQWQDRRQRIGQFMLAYAQDCTEHILSPKYREVLNIEGNIIVNPARAASHITQYLANQLNRVASYRTQDQTVEYYLDILDHGARGTGYDEILDLMDGYQKHQQQIPNAWEKVEARNEKRGETVRIQLPGSVRAQIVQEIKARRERRRLHALIIGINEYDPENLSPLYSAREDAQKMSSFLNSQLVRCSVTVLANTVEQQFRIKFQELINEMQPEDTLLFYFAGYGGTTDYVVSQSDAFKEKHIYFKDSQGRLELSQNGLAPFIKHMPPRSQLILIIDAGFEETVRGQQFQQQQQIKPGAPFNILELRSRGSNWSEADDLYAPVANVQNREAASEDFPEGFRMITITAARSNRDAFENAEGGLFTQALISSWKQFQQPFTINELLKQIETEIDWPQSTPLLSGSNTSIGDQYFLSSFQEFPVQKRIAQVRRGETTELDLSGLALSRIPLEVFELASLTRLNLSGNPLSQLDIPAGALPRLESLNLNGCQFRAVDLFFEPERFPALKVLSLDNNQIRFIDPAWFQHGARGIRLSFHGNPIQNVSESLLGADYIRFQQYFENLASRATESASLTVLWLDMDGVSSDPFAPVPASLENSERINFQQLDVRNNSELFEALYHYHEQTVILHIINFEKLGNDLEVRKDFFETLRIALTPKQIPLIILEADLPLAERFEPDIDYPNVLFDAGFPACLFRLEKGGAEVEQVFMDGFYRFLQRGESLQAAFEQAEAQAQITKVPQPFDYTLAHREKEVAEWRLEIEEVSEATEAAQDESTSSGKLYALLVGINEYVGTKERLRGCVNDVEQFRSTLDINRSLFQELEYRLLLNEQATYENVRSTFQSFLGQAESDDTVLFYFTGFGTRIKTNLSLEGEAGNNPNALVLFDSRAIQRHLFGIELQLWAKKLNTQQPFISIIDTSFSGDPLLMGTRMDADEYTIKYLPSVSEERSPEEELAQINSRDFTAPRTVSVLSQSSMQAGLEILTDNKWQGVFSTALNNQLQLNPQINWAEIRPKIRTEIEKLGLSARPRFHFSDEEDLKRPVFNLPPSESSEQDTPSISWPAPSIYINDLDGLNAPNTRQAMAVIFDDDLNRYCTDEREGATYWLNIFNHCAYFSQPDDPFRPLGRPIDLATASEEMVRQQFYTFINAFRLRYARPSNRKAKNLVQVELKLPHEKDWITSQDGHVFRISDPSIDRMSFRFRVRNISEQPIFVGLLTIYSDGGITARPFNDQCKALAPGETAEVYDHLKKNPYIKINDYNFEFHWPEEFFTYKILISEATFDPKYYAQQPPWRAWPNFEQQREEGMMVAPPAFHAQQFHMSITNPRADEYDLNQLNKLPEPEIRGPILAQLHRRYLQFSELNEQAYERYLDRLDDLDYQRFQRRFEAITARQPKTPRYLLIGKEAFIQHDNFFDTLFHLHRQEMAILPSLDLASELNAKAIPQGVRYLIIYEIPDLMLEQFQGGAQIKISVNTVQNALNNYIRILESTYTELIDRLPNHGLVFIGQDYLNWRQVVEALNLPNKKQLLQILEKNQDLANTYVDQLNNVLWELSQRFERVQFIDLRKTSQADDWKTPWEPAPEYCEKLAELIARALIA